MALKDFSVRRPNIMQPEVPQEKTDTEAEHARQLERKLRDIPFWLEASISVEERESLHILVAVQALDDNCTLRLSLLPTHNLGITEVFIQPEAALPRDYYLGEASNILSQTKRSGGFSRFRFSHPTIRPTES